MSLDVSLMVIMQCEVFTANVTHNLNHMAREAGLYQLLWRPDEIEVTTAKQLIEPLKIGVALLESDPERFRKLNPSNGWGTYEGLIAFVRDYIEACEQHPDATIEISR